MALKTETVPIDSIIPHPDNARLHSEENLAAIKRSLERFGQRKPIVVWKGKVIAGCGTWTAMKSLGKKTIDITRCDAMSERDAKMYSIVDNRTTDMSEFDWSKIQAQVGEFSKQEKDLSVLGFREFELKNILGGSAGADAMLPDDLPDPEADALKDGLGRFIVVYGSEEEKAQVARFLGVDGSKVVYQASDILTRKAPPKTVPQRKKA